MPLVTAIPNAASERGGHSALELGGDVAIVQVVAGEHREHAIALFGPSFGFPPGNRFRRCCAHDFFTIAVEPFAQPRRLRQHGVAVARADSAERNAGVHRPGLE